MPCDHDHDTEYLYPSDASILEVTDDRGDLRVTIALPCPGCGQALSLGATVDEVEEADVELPLDDDRYD